MSTAKNILLAAALSMLGSSAFAMEYTVSTSVSRTPTDYGNTDRGQAPVVLTLDGFDSAGHDNGILTGVTLTLQGEGDLSAIVTNDTGDNQQPTIFNSLVIQLRTAPGTNVAGVSNLSNFVLESQSFDLDPGASGFFGPYSVAQTRSFSPTDLSPFGASSLSFYLQAYTELYSDTDGIILSDVTATAGAAFSVTYSYDAGLPSAVPEPASMALLGAGVAGVGLFRRKRAQSTSAPV